jgi:uncharacterized phage-associated protein
MAKTIDIRTIVQAIYYLIKKLGIVDKLKLLKLIYLADKYHLIYYGRTITNDDYYAVKLGPIPSAVKDVLEFDKFSLSEEEYKYASSFLKKIDQYNFKANAKVRTKLEMLSETDIEALDYVIKIFGLMSSSRLVNYTHKYPEWSQYRELFKSGQTKRERIAIEELLSVVDRYFKVSDEHLEESRRIIKGAPD